MKVDLQHSKGNVLPLFMSHLVSFANFLPHSQTVYRKLQRQMTKLNETISSSKSMDFSGFEQLR